MPDLDWDELAFLECLGVVPEEEDDVFTYRVERENGTLLLTVLPYQSAVQLSLFPPRSDAELVGFILFVRGRARHVNDPRGEYLEFQDCVVAPPHFWSTEPEAFSHDRFAEGSDVQVSVKPRIQVRFN